MESRILRLLPAVIAGMLIGAIAMQVLTSPMSGTSVPSHGLTTATGCAGAEDPRGWIGVVPNSGHLAVYLSNYSATHDAADVEIRGDLTQAGANAWVLDISVSPITTEKDLPDTCQPRSIINAAIALPHTAESLRVVVVDGELVAVVDTVTEAPMFAYLDE